MAAVGVKGLKVIDITASKVAMSASLVAISYSRRLKPVPQLHIGL